jgi:predicted transposase/invertase (TIGR01784 family)
MGLEQTLDAMVRKAKREGKTAGKLEGKLEGKEEVAKRMIAMGMETEFISKATDFSLEQIERLRDSF